MTFVIVAVFPNKLDARAFELVGRSPYDENMVQIRDYHNDGTPYVGNIPSSEVYGSFETAAEAAAAIARAKEVASGHDASVKALEEQARLARLAVNGARQARDTAWRGVLGS